MTGFVLPLSWLLYVIVAAWLLCRGWPIRAGLGMLAAALLPWVIWFIALPHPWGPGLGIVAFLTLAQLLVALLPIAFGLAYICIRYVGKRSSV